MRNDYVVYIHKNILNGKMTKRRRSHGNTKEDKYTHF